MRNIIKKKTSFENFPRVNENMYSGLNSFIYYYHSSSSISDDSLSPSKPSNKSLLSEILSSSGSKSSS